MTTIGVLSEPSFETRISLLPEHVIALKKKGVNVLIETDAGKHAYITDEAYVAAGAQIGSRHEVLNNSDVVLSIHLHHQTEWKNKIFIGIYQPLYNAATIKSLADQGCTIFSLDMLPRTTRAQSMDILSSQANIAGYKAVLLAAQLLPKYFPMLMTSAGTIPPAKVLIIGAGVAGLQAIATAKRLGAVVEVFDTRPAVKEEVQSLGAKFIEIEGALDASHAGGYAIEQTEAYKIRQQQMIADAAAKADVIITTAAIPGKKAPVLISKDTIHRMKPGSVIIDLAAATGGNTEVTENDKTVIYHFVTIIGNSSLPSTMSIDASKLYGKNILNFLQLIIKNDGSLYLNWEDELVKESCMCCNGAITHQRITSLL